MADGASLFAKLAHHGAVRLSVVVVARPEHLLSLREGTRRDLRRDRAAARFSISLRSLDPGSQGT